MKQKKIIEFETNQNKYDLMDLTAYPHKFYIWIEVKPKKKEYNHYVNERGNLAFVYMVEDKKFIDVYGGGIEFKLDIDLLDDITSFMKQKMVIDLEGNFPTDTELEVKMSINDFDFI